MYSFVLRTVTSIVAAISMVLCLALPAHPCQDVVFDPTTLPACADEDGTDWSCYWDAGTRSNGRGSSFWVDSEGTVVYL